jgi:hypothetical protein
VRPCVRARAQLAGAGMAPACTPLSLACAPSRACGLARRWSASFTGTVAARVQWPARGGALQTLLRLSLSPVCTGAETGSALSAARVRGHAEQGATSGSARPQLSRSNSALDSLLRASRPMSATPSMLTTLREMAPPSSRLCLLPHLLDCAAVLLAASSAWRRTRALRARRRASRSRCAPTALSSHTRGAARPGSCLVAHARRGAKALAARGRDAGGAPDAPRRRRGIALGRIRERASSAESASATETGEPGRALTRAPPAAASWRGG